MEYLFLVDLQNRKLYDTWNWRNNKIRSLGTRSRRPVVGYFLCVLFVLNLWAKLEEKRVDVKMVNGCDV